VVSSVGVIAVVSVKLSGDELKKRTVRRKTKVRVWSSVGLVMRCVCGYLSLLGWRSLM